MFASGFAWRKGKGEDAWPALGNVKAKAGSLRLAMSRSRSSEGVIFRKYRKLLQQIGQAA